MSDIDALVETVRENVTHIFDGKITGEITGHAEDCPGCKIEPALSELAGIARKFNAMDSRYHELWHEETDRAEEAEDVSTRARDEIVGLALRLKTAEAEHDRLKDALREIAHVHDDGPLGTHEGDIARAALADVGATVVAERDRDAFVLECVKRWVKIAQEEGYSPITEWRNFLNEIDHSALLRRLLSGKEPFAERPPTKHSYPDYDEMERRAALADVGGTEETPG